MTSKKETASNGDKSVMNSGLNIASKGESEFVIVVSKTASEDIKDAASFLSKALELSTGAKLSVVTDDAEETKNEILIGDTNREESSKNATNIKENEYRVQVFNGKLCFNADNYFVLRTAINDFLLKQVDFMSVCEYKTEKNCSISTDYSIVKNVKNYIPVNPIYEKDDFDGSALVGLFEGKTVFVKDKSEELGKDLGMHFTDFIQIGNEYWCYYIESMEGEKSAVGLAVTTDGTVFTKRATVLLPSENGWDSKFASFPGIWYDNGIFYLAYEGAGDSAGAIGLATSKDGINFEKKGKILDATGKGIYSVNVGTPDLFKKDGKWYLSYHTYDGLSCQLCVAIGTDLMNLKHHKANPVIPTSKDGPDSGTTGRRDVIFYDGWFYMTYEISTKQPYSEAQWSHTFARSKDFINWETVEQLIPSNKGFGNDGPSFAVIDGKLWVYYRMGATMRYMLELKGK